MDTAIKYLVPDRVKPSFVIFDIRALLSPLNIQNSARFLTTFDFDREYLRNGSTGQISEKQLINYTAPSTLDDKKLVNFGPVTKRYSL